MKEQGNVNYGDDGGSRSYSIQIDVAEIVRSRYTSLINLRFTVQWIYASLVAHLYLLYEGTRMRYPLHGLSTAVSTAAVDVQPLWTTNDPGSAGRNSMIDLY